MILITETSLMIFQIQLYLQQPVEMAIPFNIFVHLLNGQSLYLKNYTRGCHRKF
jgi:hypothetical protein